MNVRVTTLSFGVAMAGLVLLSSCGNSARNATATAPDGDAGGAVGVGGADTGTAGEHACDGDTVVLPKRIVRLSFHQLSRTIHSLFDDALGQQVDVDYEIGSQSANARTFPPLASPREGSVIGTTIWPTNDRIAAAVGEYTLGHLDTVTGCGTEPSEACASTFVAAFAEKAFRRPLTEAETISVAKLYTEVKGTYGTVAEAIQYTVYGLMQSPQLLYRTELGADHALAGPLNAYELASELSYFLTDGPPDQELLDAAKAGELTTRSELTSHIARLLLTSIAQKNLESAMFSYFKLDNLMTVKIDDPGFTSGTSAQPYLGVRESAYRESQLFFEKVLWGGPLAELLTTKTAAINTTLAALYGITLPTTPADETSFVQVELPATRGGLLTQAAFLASGSRPDGDDSVVARGLVINAALLCAQNPPFPTDPATLEKVTQIPDPNATAREKAEYRSVTEPCGECHRGFDPYGLALQTYDGIGRYRTMDAQGYPIEPSVTLPANAGGGIAKDAIDMQRQIASSPAFASCVAKNIFNWALAEGVPVTPNSCATARVVEGFEAGDQTFSSLLQQIAVSEGFTQRLAGLSR
jgi:hypothetical protein